MKPYRKELFYIFTVTEVAEICGVSSQTINKRIRNMTAEQLEKYVVFLKPNETKLKQVSKQGLLYFKSVYGIIDEPQEETKKESNNNSADSEVIAILKEELRIKNEQIAMLMEQNRNFQVLLHKAEEVKALPEVKKSFLSRLFGRKE